MKIFQEIFINEFLVNSTLKQDLKCIIRLKTIGKKTKNK